MKAKLQAYGDQGVLVSRLDDASRARLISAAERCPPDSFVEFVSGYDSLLFIFSGNPRPEIFHAWLERILGSSGGTTVFKRKVLNVPVRYGGPDLESVAETLGMRREEVVQRHSEPVYTVRMMGFSPGFPYLDGLDPSLHLPRRDSPRDRIEPGTVAIGGSHAGIYSVASPGGWHLLGHTDLKLFDVENARGSRPESRNVFLLAPGDRLKFQPIN